MTLTRGDGTATIGRDAARPASTLPVAAPSLIGLAFLVSLLPGIERLLPGTSVALVALTGAVAWIYDAAFLLLALPSFGVIAARSYVSLDPTAEEVAESLAQEEV